MNAIRNRNIRNDRRLTALELDRHAERARNRNQAEQQLLDTTLEKLSNSEQNASRITRRFTDELKSTLQELSIASGGRLSPHVAKNQHRTRRGSVDSAMSASQIRVSHYHSRPTLTSAYLQGNRRRRCSVDNGDLSLRMLPKPGIPSGGDSKLLKRRGSTGAVVCTKPISPLVSPSRISEESGELPHPARPSNIPRHRRFSENDVCLAKSISLLKINSIGESCRCRRSSLVSADEDIAEDMITRDHKSKTQLETKTLAFQTHTPCPGDQNGDKSDDSKSTDGAMLSSKSSHQDDTKVVIVVPQDGNNCDEVTTSNDINSNNIIQDECLPEEKVDLINSWLTTTRNECASMKQNSDIVSDETEQKTSRRPNTPRRSRLSLPIIKISDSNARWLDPNSDDNFRMKISTSADSGPKSIIPTTPQEAKMEKRLRDARRKSFLAMPATYAALSRRRRHSTPDISTDVKYFGAKRLLQDMGERRKSEEEDLECRIREFLQKPVTAPGMSSASLDSSTSTTNGSEYDGENENST